MELGPAPTRLRALCTLHTATANPSYGTRQSTGLSVTDGADAFDRALSANYNETANEAAVSEMLAGRDYVNCGNAPNLTNLASKQPHGEVTEWFMVPLSKSGLCASGAWVRIPPSPPSATQPKEMQHG